MASIVNDATAIAFPVVGLVALGFLAVAIALQRPAAEHASGPSEGVGPGTVPTGGEDANG